MRRARLLSTLLSVVLLAVPACADTVGSIFLTGHDPDFHAALGADVVGAQHLNQAAIAFITNPTFNPFVAGGMTTLLVVQSNPASVPAGHTNGFVGILGSDAASAAINFAYVVADASTLNAQLDLLGVTYAGLIVVSDFGGLLSQAELDILNGRSTDIIDFLNSGGGLYAMAESNGGSHLTPGGGHFGFLPCVVTSTAFDQTESGFTVTPFGAGLGLTNDDVNGNFSHNVFASGGTCGLNAVDIDALGNVMSLAGRGTVDEGGHVGVVPEPTTMALVGAGLVGLLRRRKAS